MNKFIKWYLILIVLSFTLATLNNYFKNGYIMAKENELVGFGKAIEALKEGKRVSRNGWKGLFVFMQVPGRVSVTDTVPKMQSLPQYVKDEFIRRNNKTGNGLVHINSLIEYDNQMAIVNVYNRISGWAPSGNDTLAVDWIVLD